LIFSFAYLDSLTFPELTMMDELPQNKQSGLWIILLTSFLAYGLVLQADFKTLDDYVTIINNDTISHFSHLREIFTSSYFHDGTYYRPLVFLSFLLERQLFGLTSFFYYLTNISLHLLNVWVIYLLLSDILKEQRIVFWVTWIFAVHPAHWVAVSNITGRSVLLSVFFSLLCFYSFIRFTQRQGYRWFILSLAAYVGGLLSRESAAAILLILILYRLVLERSVQKDGKAKLFSFLPFLVILGGYFYIRQILHITQLFQERSFHQWGLDVLSFLRGSITLIRLMLLPVDLHFDRTREVFSSFTEPGLVLTAIGFVIFICGLVFLRKKIPPLAWFFLGWFWVSLLPSSQMLVPLYVQPGYISLGEHFLYFPSIGLFVLGGMGMKAVYQKMQERNMVSDKVILLACGGITLFFFLMTIQQNIYTRHTVNLHEQALQYEPHNSRMRRSYIFELIRLKMYPQLEKQFQAILQANPGDVEARIGLGKALCDQDRCWEGLKEYQKIQQAGIWEKLLEENKRLTYNILIQQYENQLTVEPHNKIFLQRLGEIYRDLGDEEKSSDHFSKNMTLEEGKN